MFIVESYAVAIIMCFITMICWGSWANTTKLVSNKKWEFPLFYWDYSIGLLLCSLLFAFTLGSMGEAGRSFIPDIQQASSSSLMSAILAGIICKRKLTAVCSHQTRIGNLDAHLI
ncbi:hypothetical protein L3W92_24525 [Escherichia coli]|nr:hypothetical protein [Escherichia coli]MCF7310754.1 hypothetical protein [Escherichia coli]MCF7360382.1 hypothetical protein [Escherichia coli]MCF7378452.1 hypothetical protein [Escherichia coli]